jgi:hypothetical protein|tara:strand:+ start:195 stop:344 length:150 start_codon:yes stop_codon:yes gene_type:complete
MDFAISAQESAVATPALILWDPTTDRRHGMEKIAASLKYGRVDIAPSQS